MRLMDYFEVFVRDKLPAAMSINSYQRVYKMFDQYLDRERINDPIAEHVVDFCHRAIHRTGNDNTPAVYARFLNLIFSYLENNNLYQNIVNRAMGQFPRDKARRSILPSDNATINILRQRFADATSQMERRNILIVLLSAHNIGDTEIALLCTTDCLNHNEIKRVRTRKELYPLQAIVAAALRTYIQDYEIQGYIFTDVNHRKPRTEHLHPGSVSMIITKELKQMGIYMPNLTARSLGIWGRSISTPEIL